MFNSNQAEEDENVVSLTIKYISSETLKEGIMWQIAHTHTHAHLHTQNKK